MRIVGFLLISAFLPTSAQAKCPENWVKDRLCKRLGATEAIVRRNALAMVAGFPDDGSASREEVRKYFKKNFGTNRGGEIGECVIKHYFRVYDWSGLDKKEFIDRSVSKCVN